MKPMADSISPEHYTGHGRNILCRFVWMVDIEDEEYPCLYAKHRENPNDQDTYKRIGWALAVSDVDSPYYVLNLKREIVGVLETKWEVAQYLIAQHEGLYCPLVPWEASV